MSFRYNNHNRNHNQSHNHRQTRNPYSQNNKNSSSSHTNQVNHTTTTTNTTNTTNSTTNTNTNTNSTNNTDDQFSDEYDYEGIDWSTLPLPGEGDNDNDNDHVSATGQDTSTRDDHHGAGNGNIYGNINGGGNGNGNGDGTNANATGTNLNLNRDTSTSTSNSNSSSGIDVTATARGGKTSSSSSYSQSQSNGRVSNVYKRNNQSTSQSQSASQSTSVSGGNNTNINGNINGNIYRNRNSNSAGAGNMNGNNNGNGHGYSNNENTITASNAESNASTRTNASTNATKTNNNNNASASISEEDDNEISIIETIPPTNTNNNNTSTNTNAASTSTSTSTSIEALQAQIAHLQTLLAQKDDRLFDLESSICVVEAEAQYKITESAKETQVKKEESEEKVRELQTIVRNKDRVIGKLHRKLGNSVGNNSNSNSNGGGGGGNGNGNGNGNGGGNNKKAKGVVAEEKEQGVELPLEQDPMVAQETYWNMNNDTNMNTDNKKAKANRNRNRNSENHARKRTHAHTDASNYQISNDNSNEKGGMDMGDPSEIGVDANRNINTNNHMDDSNLDMNMDTDINMDMCDDTNYMDVEEVTPVGTSTSTSTSIDTSMNMSEEDSKHRRKSSDAATASKRKSHKRNHRSISAAAAGRSSSEDRTGAGKVPGMNAIAQASQTETPLQQYENKKSSSQPSSSKKPHQIMMEMIQDQLQSYKDATLTMMHQRRTRQNIKKNGSGSHNDNENDHNHDLEHDKENSNDDDEARRRKRNRFLILEREFKKERERQEDEMLLLSSSTSKPVSMSKEAQNIDDGVDVDDDPSERISSMLLHLLWKWSDVDVDSNANTVADKDTDLRLRLRLDPSKPLQNHLQVTPTITMTNARETAEYLARHYITMIASSWKNSNLSRTRHGSTRIASNSADVHVDDIDMNMGEEEEDDDDIFADVAKDQNVLKGAKQRRVEQKEQRQLEQSLLALDRIALPLQMLVQLCRINVYAKRVFRGWIVQHAEEMEMEMEVGVESPPSMSTSTSSMFKMCRLKVQQYNKKSGRKGRMRHDSEGNDKGPMAMDVNGTSSTSTSNTQDRRSRRRMGINIRSRIRGLPHEYERRLEKTSARFMSVLGHDNAAQCITNVDYNAEWNPHDCRLVCRIFLDCLVGCIVNVDIDLVGTGQKLQSNEKKLHWTMHKKIQLQILQLKALELFHVLLVDVDGNAYRDEAGMCNKFRDNDNFWIAMLCTLLSDREIGESERDSQQQGHDDIISILERSTFAKMNLGGRRHHLIQLCEHTDLSIEGPVEEYKNLQCSQQNFALTKDELQQRIIAKMSVMDLIRQLIHISPENITHILHDESVMINRRFNREVSFARRLIAAIIDDLQFFVCSRFSKRGNFIRGRDEPVIDLAIILQYATSIIRLLTLLMRSNEGFKLLRTEMRVGGHVQKSRSMQQIHIADGGAACCLAVLVDVLERLVRYIQLNCRGFEELSHNEKSRDNVAASQCIIGCIVSFFFDFMSACNTLKGAHRKHSYDGGISQRRQKKPVTLGGVLQDSEGKYSFIFSCRTILQLESPSNGRDVTSTSMFGKQTRHQIQAMLRELLDID